MSKITFGGKPSTADKMKTVEKRLGATTGVSKGAAKVPRNPKITPSGTKPLKKQIGVKATWKF